LLGSSKTHSISKERNGSNIIKYQLKSYQWRRSILLFKVANFLVPSLSTKKLSSITLSLIAKNAATASLSSLHWGLTASKVFYEDSKFTIARPPFPPHTPHIKKLTILILHKKAIFGGRDCRVFWRSIEKFQREWGDPSVVRVQLEKVTFNVVKRAAQYHSKSGHILGMWKKNFEKKSGGQSLYGVILGQATASAKRAVSCSVFYPRKKANTSVKFITQKTQIRWVTKTILSVLAFSLKKHRQRSHLASISANSPEVHKVVSPENSTIECSVCEVSGPNCNMENHTKTCRTPDELTRSFAQFLSLSKQK
jgi:hypothetical protein